MTHPPHQSGSHPDGHSMVVLLSFKHGPPSCRGGVHVCVDERPHSTCRLVLRRQRCTKRHCGPTSHDSQVPASTSQFSKRSFLSKCALLSCLCSRENPTLTVSCHCTYTAKIKSMAKSTPVSSRVLSLHEPVQVNASQLRFPPAIQSPCQLYHPKIPVLWRVMQFAACCFPEYLH